MIDSHMLAAELTGLDPEISLFKTHEISICLFKTHEKFRVKQPPQVIVAV